MASHTRTRSNTASGPHSLSLKVLRLSRPSLATQTPLPPSADIPATASLAHPSGDVSSSFPLAPLLTLPAAFGAAYVGETFTCTLCADNELGEGERKGVSGVKMSAELQTPTRQEGIALELSGQDGEEDKGVMPPGDTLQRTLRHELKDEGPHVLAVTVTYTETLLGREGPASGGRVRTFRKLYQFVAQQLLAVRSKVTERKRQGREARQWVLEAQLENVGEASIVLESVVLKERENVSGRAMNGDEDGEATVLKPSDVEQVMFSLEEKSEAEDLASRVPLGQLNIDWRGAMGEHGSLTTGWLASRGR